MEFKLTQKHMMWCLSQAVKKATPIFGIAIAILYREQVQRSKAITDGINFGAEELDMDDEDIEVTEF